MKIRTKARGGNKMRTNIFVSRLDKSELINFEDFFNKHKKVQSGII